MNYNRIFKKITHNESVYYSEVNNNITLKKRIKLNIYFFFFSCVVLLFSLFSKKKYQKESFAISWNPLHIKKIRSVKPLIEILDISNGNLLSWSNIFILSNVSFKKVFKNIFELKNYTKSSFNYSSFFYKLYVIILLDALENYTKKMDKIFISGHFDRLTTIISEVCLVNNIKLNIIQHGCIQVFEKKLIRNKINGDIYYSYNFSKSYFNLFLEFNKNTLFNKVDNLNSSNFYNFKLINKEIITYGCQDAVPDNNFQIINFLIKNFKNYLIYIIPHPREKISMYESKYSLNTNVFISNQKPKNSILFISRFSTLGIEYNEIGVRTIFINLDDVKMDFILENKHDVYKNLEDFESKFKI